MTDEIARVIAKATELTGDETQAVDWFHHRPVSGFGGVTAEQLVREGHAGAVMDHLTDLENGGYA